jgi:cytochrome c-type biogenesis protein CcmH
VIRRAALPLAAAALVALAALVGFTLLRPVPAPAAGQIEAQLAGELRCPDCAGLSVAESTSASASAIRTEISRLLDAGATPDEVRQHFVDRYGSWILLSPAAPVAWWLPVLIVLAFAAALVAWLLRARSSSPASAEPQPADALVEQVRREAETLDA